MSYFADNGTTLISTEIAFGAASASTRSYMTCINGDVIGWQYDHTDANGNILINLYNATDGTDTLVATVYAMPGCDLFRGLFSSGAIPSHVITDPNCVYFRVDYI